MMDSPGDDVIAVVHGAVQGTLDALFPVCDQIPGVTPDISSLPCPPNTTLT